MYNYTRYIKSPQSQWACLYGVHILFLVQDFILKKKRNHRENLSSISVLKLLLQILTIVKHNWLAYNKFPHQKQMIIIYYEYLQLL